MNEVGEQDTGSCPNERQVNCKQCDNLRSTRRALQLLLRLKRILREPYQLLQWVGAFAC